MLCQKYIILENQIKLKLINYYCIQKYVYDMTWINFVNMSLMRNDSAMNSMTRFNNQ